MDRTDLTKVFKNLSGKTLKTQLQPGVDLLTGIVNAKSFVNTNTEGYTRVEFAHDGCYYVIAKLKPQEPQSVGICMARGPKGYVCTLDKGHKFPHRALDTALSSYNDRVYNVW